MEQHEHYLKMPDKKTWLMLKPHQHVMLDPVRASLESQIFGKEETVEDSQGVAFAKERIATEGETIETLKYLSDKLNKQLRYRESIECLKRALGLAIRETGEDSIIEKTESNELKEDNKLTEISDTKLTEAEYNKQSKENRNKQQSEIEELQILLAGRYLTTCQVDEALEIYLTLDPSHFDFMLPYRIGLCYFYKAEYEKAKPYFLEGIKTTDDNPDMYIAFIYWYLFCFVELGQDVTPALSLYKDCFVIHHAGYEYAIRMFLGDEEWEFEENSMHDNLTRIMFLFGLYEYCKWKKEDDIAPRVYEACLECSEYWASYSGIAVWMREKEKKLSILGA